ncbi:hypothetical protein PUMCH_001042 [Australozyma saopauloensis]|uniref:PWWP domain-containing protein n=1 Tax=Australozyma saopauloensis TaxID=291208 RepID=A0AAX4H6E2_9ASCO|nr:hypothetical protein PUMCH_001042 [[Candida] saopauloensis]
MPPKSSSAKFQPKDMVLAKMTGFPAWPSFVMPPEMISEAIMKAKKKTTNTCVIFIPDGDFNWMNEKSLEILTPEKLKTRISKLPKDKLKPKPRKQGSRTNNVGEALVAADGLVFDEFMQELADNAPKDEEEEEEELEEDIEDADAIADAPAGTNAGADAAEQESASSRKRRRNAPVMSDDDQDDSNLNDIPESNSDNESISKPLQTPNGRRKSTDNGASTKRTKLEATNGQKRRSSSTPQSNASHTNGKDKLVKKENGTASPKVMSEKERQHHFWLCRVKLQRSLIQRNQAATPKDPKAFPPPTADELLVARLILNRLDLYPVDVELLRDTKIHKVLKCILKDEDLAYPDSFRLHEKCEELLKKWKEPMDQLKTEKLSRASEPSAEPKLEDESVPATADSTTVSTDATSTSIATESK